MSRSGLPCYRNGGCGPYEMLSCTECPASKSDYLQCELKPKPQTNAGRIRAKTDEELADYAYKTLGNYCCPPEREFDANNCMGSDCSKCWLDWLQSEVTT